jgi:hypothetical protein
MKHLLQEIGEATLEPYAYRLDFTINQAHFSSAAGHQYEVDFRTDPQGVMEIHFAVVDASGRPDQYTETNEGVTLRVMSTITAIIKKAVARLSPREIVISAAKSDQRRMRLYRQYVAKHLTGYDEVAGDEAWSTYKKTPKFDLMGIWKRRTQFDATGIKDKP